MLLKELLPFIADNSTNINLHFARGSHVPEEALDITEIRSDIDKDRIARRRCYAL